MKPCKNKKLTNVRSAGADDALALTPPRKLSLEDALEYIGDDELVEITPESIRLRKKYAEAVVGFLSQVWRYCQILKA